MQFFLRKLSSSFCKISYFAQLSPKTALVSGKGNREVWIYVTRCIFTQFALVFCSVSSADADWYHELPALPSPHNKSEPTWDWGDEQGFSALRHSGETYISAAIFPGLVWSHEDCLKSGDSLGIL